MTIRAESDLWGAGPSVLDPKVLSALEAALEETRLIVEHRFYRGSRAPARLIFDAFDDLTAYLHIAQPGDSFRTWRFETLCRDDNLLVTAKRPDADGQVPAGGAY